MLKILRRVLQVTLGILALPFISILLQVIFKLNLNESLVNFYVTITIGFVLILILRRKNFYAIPLTVIWGFAVILCLKKYYEHHQITSIETNWLQDPHVFSRPFFTAPSGHIFIRVDIKGQAGYMGFDTGAEITGIRESDNQSLTKISMNITDSQGKAKRMNLSLLDSLSFGNLLVNKLSYIPMPDAAWEKCGIFYRQDSIIGVFGNNFINHFVWDFDMVNKNIRIGETAPIIESDKSETIDLYKTGMNSWGVTLSLGGEKKKVKFDTGSDQCITLQDTLSFSKAFLYTSPNYSEHRGLFSYVDCNGNQQQVDTTIRTQRKVFADIKVNKSLIRNVYINDQQPSNLLGIPLIWEYERVILDFPNQRIRLMKQKDVESPYGITQKSHNQIRSMKKDYFGIQGYFENNHDDTLKIRGVMPNKNDTVTYNLIGLTKTFGHLEKFNQVIIDSILSISKDTTLRTNEFIPLNYDFFNEL